MATDGPDPVPCDTEIFENGTAVFITHSIASNAMEGWVRRVAEESGQRVDWHFTGGRAVVKAIGDLHRVCDAVERLLPEHDALFREAMLELGPDYVDHIPPGCWVAESPDGQTHLVSRHTLD